MKVYIDVSVLTLATFVTGIQRVTREITVRLIGMGDAEIVLLHYNARGNKYYRIDNKSFIAYYVHNQRKKEKMITRQVVELQEIGQGDVFFDLDAAWMSRVKRSYLLPVLKRQGARIVAHIYDIISVTHPEYCLQRGVYNFMDYIGAHLQYADEMIVNAQATVDELHKLSGQLQVLLPQCHVVPLGADYGKREIVADSQMPTELVTAVKDKPYILMVGTIEPRKNHNLLLEAYERGFKDMGYNIIMAGYMGWNMDAFAERISKHPDYKTRIFHFEGLEDVGITYLYQHARFLAFCSYVEGYGLPIIESIMRGTPVLASDILVSREVAEDYCVYFEQDNVDDLCGLVEYYEKNEGEYEKIVMNLENFVSVGWRESAEKIYKVIMV